VEATYLVPRPIFREVVLSVYPLLALCSSTHRTPLLLPLTLDHILTQQLQFAPLDPPIDTPLAPTIFATAHVTEELNWFIDAQA